MWERCFSSSVFHEVFCNTMKVKIGQHFPSFGAEKQGEATAVTLSETVFPHLGKLRSLPSNLPPNERMQKPCRIDTVENVSSIKKEETTSCVEVIMLSGISRAQSAERHDMWKLKKKR